MPSRSKRGGLSLRPAKSTSRTSNPPARPSLHPAEEGTEDLADKKTNESATFNFLLLPSELRNKIYQMVYSTAPQVIDLDPSTFGLLRRNKLLALFGVSHQVSEEATHHFFSTRTFRLFPTYPGRYLKTTKPLVARLPTRYRASITTLEMRLGPNWRNPPPGWVVNSALGLRDCTSVRLLKVFVECDPSDAVFNGFRIGDGFYERFSQNLLDSVLKVLPSIRVVEFDGWPSVKRTGDMVSGLESVAVRYNKIVGWGPERRWDDDTEAWMAPIMVHHKGEATNRALVIHA